MVNSEWRYLCEDFEEARKNRERVARKQNIEGYPSVYDAPEMCLYRITTVGYTREHDESVIYCELTDGVCLVEYGGKCVLIEKLET